MSYRLNDDDEWVRFLPAENHPQYQQFKLLQTQNLLADYEEQKSALDDLHEKMGKDGVAAKFGARQNPQNGEVRSYCVWAATISMFLPRTDDVFFFRPKGEDD